MRVAYVAAFGMLAYGGWYAWQQNNAPDQTSNSNSSADAISSLGLSGTVQTVANEIDYITGGFLKISNMRGITPAQFTNRNVQAMLRVIRTGEGTVDANGYRRIFGGQLFTSFADHPRVKVTANGYTSTAAGAYQALASSWDETASIMHLTDFSPASQDKFAVGRIAARGALDDVIAGRFDVAIKKISSEWASMPGSHYGQPVISIDKARQVFALNGGGNFA